MARSAMFRAPSLAVVTATFIAVSAALGACLLYITLTLDARDYQSEALRTAVATRASGLQFALARTLHEDWLQLKLIASRLDPDSPASLQVGLDMMVGDGFRISWAGTAKPDGQVLAASGGTLVGADVSSQQWFWSGLDAPFAGNVREAELPVDLLPAAGGRALRVINLAAPIQRNGETIGVVGLYINFHWIRDYVTEMANALSMDVFVVDRQGEIIISTAGDFVSRPQVASIRAATSGVRSASIERWPDGITYYSATLPGVVYGDLPSLGWSLVARIPADALFSMHRQISIHLIFYLAAFGLMLLFLSALFILAFIRPFSVLARNATRVADGLNVFPYESNRTSELQRIGTSIARLQVAAYGRSKRKDKRFDELPNETDQ